ncbi:MULTISPECIES: HAD-IA family hydrolase [Kribbella]|uniref:HAD-IA family hydrolase n=1 Tax=Kribbella TaxID=182639 RepID=UPI00130509BA|nr:MULTISPECIES: HAD-IA family hydrolase [Kribbella]
MTHLDWSGCLNTRDLGGLPTRYGATTRAGAVIRTDSLHQLDPDGLVAFHALGAGLVLDLRSDWEIDEPHPLEAHPTYRRIPWIDTVREAERVRADEPLMADVYRGSLERNQGQIVQALRAVAEAPEDAAVVVHCRAGKDRTGLLIALLLELVGVPRAVIAADYAMSEERLGVLAALENHPGTEEERAAAAVLARTLPETILDSLDHVDSQYGGVRAYLAACGLTAGEIHRLATRLVDVPIEAVVFDFDGLLMDTETTLVESWRAEWQWHGLELDVEDGFFPGHGGDTLEMHDEKLAAAVGPGYDRERSQARRLAHRDELHRTLDFRPGIHEWLREARELGLRIAIASSSARPWVVGHLERVGAVGLFDLIVTGDEVSMHKPDPEIYLLALKRLGLDGASAVAIEDTAHGVAAAAAAGMATVAIPNPFVLAEAVGQADLVLGLADEVPLSEALLKLSVKA